MRIQLTAADPAPIIRAGLEYVLSSQKDFLLITVAGDRARALRDIRKHRPDVAVVDFEFASRNRFEMLASIARSGIATHVLVYAMVLDGADIHDVVSAGGAGFISKHEPIERLHAAIRKISAGKPAISDDAQLALHGYLRRLPHPAPHRTPPERPLITDRELSVLRALARGTSIAATARALNMSPSTVKNHRQSAFAKLTVRNAPAAVYAAMRRGLLT